MPDTEDGHRFFSRNVALFGAAIGLAFFAAMFFASVLLGEDAIVTAHASKLPSSVPLEAACGADTTKLMADQEGRIRLSYGKGTEYFLVSASAPLADAVLAVGSIVDRAELYRCEGEMPIRTGMIAGDTVPFSLRPLKSTDIAFPVSQVTTSHQFVLGITQNAFIASQLYFQNLTLFHDIGMSKLNTRLFLYGAIAALIVYNFVLSFVAGQPTFLFNALAVSSMLSQDMYLSGFSAAYLWPESPWLSNVALGLSLAGPTLFAPVYAYHFLEERPLPVFFAHPVYWIWPAASLVGIAAMTIIPLWSAYIFHIALWIVMTLTFVVILLRRMASGSERGAILLVPMLGVIVPTMTIGSLKEFGGVDFGRIGEHATEIALLLEALLFTLALAYLLRLSRWRESAALETANQLSQSVNKMLIETLDKERARVAGELHDTAGQGVVLIVNRLKRLSARSRIGQALRADIADTERLAGSMLSEIREISHSLHPAVLDHLGFEQAARALVENLSKANPHRITVQFPNQRIPLTKNQALQLYRIVQELLSNALMHAQADTVHLSVTPHEHAMVLAISDNGMGLDDGPGSSSQHGIGMRLLSQRAANLPGKLTIQSGSNGTTVSVRFTPGRTAPAAEALP